MRISTVVSAEAQFLHWEFGFRQFSFHHGKQVLRDNVYKRFLAILAFLTCYGPLSLSALGKSVDLEPTP
jgi:hypothetical protein